MTEFVRILQKPMISEQNAFRIGANRVELDVRRSKTNAKSAEIRPKSAIGNTYGTKTAPTRRKIPPMHCSGDSFVIQSFRLLSAGAARLCRSAYTACF